MANIKSQIKRNRQNEGRRQRNKAATSHLRGELKAFRTAHDAGDKDTANQAFLVASRTLDKAASKGLVHANKAANKKSRMARKLAAL